MEQQQTLGDRIRFARLIKRWTQERLAKEVGCTRQSVQGWEAGNHKPSPVIANKLAAVLGCSEEELKGE